MKKKVLFWLVCLFLSVHSLAQTPLPPVYEVKNDSAESQQLYHDYWQILEDKSGKLTIEQVSSLPVQNQFHDSTSAIDSTVNTYWLRYRIRNAMKREARISLNCYWEFMDSYVLQPNGSWKHFLGGFLQDWDKKDGLKRADAMPQILEPEEEMTIYQRIHKEKAGLGPDFGVMIIGTDSFIKTYYTGYVDSRTNYFGKRELQEAFVLGLLLLAIFLNVFFYRIVGEKVYLYFSLFAFFLAVNRLWNISYAYFVWEHPAWIEFVPYLGFAWALIPFFLIQFFRQFLKTKKFYPRWDKVLIGLGVLNILPNVLLLALTLPATKTYVQPLHAFIKKMYAVPFAFFLIPLSLLITLVLFARKKEKPVTYIILGASPFLILYIVTQIQTFLGYQLIADFRLIEVVCISWLVISFTLILMMRFDLLRKENAQQALDKEKLKREKEAEKAELIEKQKYELEIQVAERTAELKKSIEELKSTQSQLIQSEKMASLGELTAGIAHEIQNPLNFVNNFSEVNIELIDEMVVEVEKGNTDEVKAIAKDIRDNEQKINHHGKRADAIVKGMLQHSRSTKNATKEPTNINALADEYLRLSYHGLRAKDKSFNAIMKTDFDSSIPKLNIVSQDMGRVVLNLLTNAFYVVNEKKKMNISGYEPTVSLSTKKLGDHVEIKVTDNGNGIPQKVLDKIFQPFFTTKPTGEGTGLGLSLSYDIIKAHGGELKVETKEGEGSEFVISLPLMHSFQ